MIDKFLFWLFLRTPEPLKRFYPSRIIDRIGKTAKNEIDCIQSDIIKSRWQLIEAQEKLKNIKRND